LSEGTPVKKECKNKVWQSMFQKNFGKLPIAVSTAGKAALSRPAA